MSKNFDIGYYISLLIVRLNLTCNKYYERLENALVSSKHYIPSPLYNFINLFFQTFKTIILMAYSSLLRVIFVLAKICGIDIITIK